MEDNLRESICTIESKVRKKEEVLSDAMDHGRLILKGFDNITRVGTLIRNS